MRLILAGLLISSLGAWGQIAVRPPTPAVGSLPYGNILFPGGLSPNQSHAGRLGATVGGRLPGGGMGPGFPGRPPYPGRPPQGPGWYPPYRQNTVVVPYAVPMYYGGYGYQDQPNVTVVVPQAPTSNVVIHNGVVSTEEPGGGLRTYSDTTTTSERPGLRVYGAPAEPRSPVAPAEPPAPGTAQLQSAAPQPSAASTAPKSFQAPSKPTIYLVALKEGTVRQAIGYWVENDTLHYVTPAGSLNRVSLDQVDQDISLQLNAERQLNFDLTPRDSRLKP
jgi:hypothetical protein